MPLYDSIYMDEILTAQPYMFFQVPIGQAEQGGAGAAATTKNLLNTNLETQGHLPAPRIFSIQGVALMVNQFVSAVTTLDAANTFRTNPLLEDYKRILHYSRYELTVGSKQYIQVPTFLVPANYGAEGGSVYDDSVPTGGDVGGTTNAQIRGGWSHTGRHYKLVPRPITIAPQQQFKVELEFDTGGQALAVGGLNTCGNNALELRIWAILYGEQGREVA